MPCRQFEAQARAALFPLDAAAAAAHQAHHERELFTDPSSMSLALLGLEQFKVSAGALVGSHVATVRGSAVGAEAPQADWLPTSGYARGFGAGELVPTPDTLTVALSHRGHQTMTQPLPENHTTGSGPHTACTRSKHWVE